MSKIHKIQLQKSRTIGVQEKDRTRFRKIQIMVEATLDDADMPADVYVELSSFLEKQFEYEKGIK